MTFRVIIAVVNSNEILNPIVIQFVVAATTMLMVIRYGLDALRHRSRSNAMKVTLIIIDAVTQAMIVYSLGIMQRPSDTNSYYQVWAVLLVTLRYSVKIGRPAGISLKQTPLVDLMSSFWAANILRSQAMKILKITGWLLWSVNSLRIIHGFLSSEFANDSHRENMRLLTDYMRVEHRVVGGGGHAGGDPTTMAGYRYLVLGESKKLKAKKKEADGTGIGRQARDTTDDMADESENIRRLVLALKEDKKVLTLEKIWSEPSDVVLDEELKDLCLSFALYKLLRRRFFNFGIHEAKLERTRRLVLEGILGGVDSSSSNSDPFAKSRRAFRVSEAELAFLNDFFNSRHAIIFAHGFPIIRLVLSTVLLGGIAGMAVAIHQFSKVAKVDELGSVHHGVVFTWILLSFLGVKEMWEITTVVFSDWTKILVLCKFVEKPWWLRGPLAKCLVGKLCRWSVWPRWHGKVGQCNLLFPTSFLRRARRSRYMVSLSDEVKRCLINRLSDCLVDRRRIDIYVDRAMESLGQNLTGRFRDVVRGAGAGVEGDAQTLLVWHIATCYCEIAFGKRRGVGVSRLSSARAFARRLPVPEEEEGAGAPIKDSLWSDYMIARTLSQYCAYVLGLLPPLVPGNSLMARSVRDKVYEEKRDLFLREKANERCDSSIGILDMLTEYASGNTTLYRGEGEQDNTILKKGAVLGKKLVEATRGGDGVIGGGGSNGGGGGSNGGDGSVDGGGGNDGGVGSGVGGGDGGISVDGGGGRGDGVGGGGGSNDGVIGGGDGGDGGIGLDGGDGGSDVGDGDVHDGGDDGISRGGSGGDSIGGDIGGVGVGVGVGDGGGGNGGDEARERELVEAEQLWKFLSEFWAGFVIHLAASTSAYQHKICLSSGGELMTHLWALLSHAGVLGSVEHGDQAIETAQTQGDVYDATTQF